VKFIADPPPPPRGEGVRAGTNTPKGKPSPHPIVSSDTNFPPPGRWARSGALAHDPREGCRPITIRVAPDPVTGQDGRARTNALPAAGGGSDRCAAALDPDPPPVTPAPDTPRGFSG